MQILCVASCSLQSLVDLDLGAGARLIPKSEDGVHKDFTSGLSPRPSLTSRHETTNGIQILSTSSTITFKFCECEVLPQCLLVALLCSIRG